MLDEERAKQECQKLGRVWEVLSNATAELTNRDVNVPPDLYTSLRGAKALISLCEAHPRLDELSPGDIDAHEGFCVGCCKADVVTRITCELRNIEDLLVIKAIDVLGSEYALRFQERAEKAWEPIEKRAVVVGRT